MQEQFIMVKFGASFQVHRNEDHLTIESVEPGHLYPFICQPVAAAQRSIAQFFFDRATTERKRLLLSEDFF